MLTVNLTVPADLVGLKLFDDKPATLPWLNRRHTAAARSSQRATVFQASPSTRAIADMLTPSTLSVTTVSNVARRCWRRGAGAQGRRRRGRRTRCRRPRLTVRLRANRDRRREIRLGSRNTTASSPYPRRNRHRDRGQPSTPGRSEPVRSPASLRLATVTNLRRPFPPRSGDSRPPRWIQVESIVGRRLAQAWPAQRGGGSWTGTEPPRPIRYRPRPSPVPGERVLVRATAASTAHRPESPHRSTDRSERRQRGCSSLQSTVQQAVAPDFFSEDGTPASTEQLVTEVILPRGRQGAKMQTLISDRRSRRERMMCPESCRRASWRKAPADWLTTLPRYAA